jgi:16S rRNA G966 N2-methylase RsmD
VVELVWPGKYRDGVRVEVPRSRAPLLVEEAYGGKPSAGTWRNRLVHGDAPGALWSLLPELEGRVSLVYVDPPFDTGGDFDFQASIPGAPDKAPRVPLRAYRDARGLDAWIAWFADVAAALRDLLAAGGGLYVHLDAHAAHYAKVVLDEIFGAGAFQREIVWRIGWVSGYKARSRGWIRNHDTLLFYAKGGRPATFHKEFVPYPPGYLRRDGKPPKGEGVPVDDVWNGHPLDRLDSIQIVSFSGEKVGYPTQKNEALLARILRASSNPGDLVLDAFVGSGTTAVVAEKLGRRWVACDASPLAIHTARKRLLSLAKPSPFVVERVDDEASSDAAATSRGKQSLKVRVRVEGKRATIDILSFALAARVMSAVPVATRESVTHWSQWIDGYCIDWDHREGLLSVGSRVWRPRGQARLPLEAAHAYTAPGRYVALVKAYDVLGGSTTKALRVDVEAP